METTSISTQGSKAKVKKASLPRSFLKPSLYVDGLDASVTEDQLHHCFSEYTPVLSVKLCSGYGYVYYNTLKHATLGMKIFDSSCISGKPMRIMLSVSDPSFQRSGCANVFVTNLEPWIIRKNLLDIFVTYGDVISCKMAIDINKVSTQYGFIQYVEEEAAQKAVNYLNGLSINSRQIYVGRFVCQEERGLQNLYTLYVNNLSTKLMDEDLKLTFSRNQTRYVTAAVIGRDEAGYSEGFGFVVFENSEDAASAIEELDGCYFDDKVWNVRWAQSHSGYLEGAILYVTNLDDCVTDEKLNELFYEFGTVSSCKVAVDSQGQSRGFGFVAFSTPYDAMKAVNGMNGKLTGEKPMCVTVVQPKEDRKARKRARLDQTLDPVLAPLKLDIIRRKELLLTRHVPLTREEPEFLQSDLPGSLSGVPLDRQMGGSEGGTQQ